MNWEKFFKPTLIKIFILILILLLTYIIPKPLSEDRSSFVIRFGDSGFGYPFVFHGIRTIAGVEYKGFFVLEFIINFLIFYLVACLLILIHENIKE